MFNPSRSAFGPAVLRWEPRRTTALLLLVLAIPSACGPAADTRVEAAEVADAAMAASEAEISEARGRYLAVVGGCNDCHTDGYMELDGHVDESLWLTGSVVGFRGPWGTTYPPNLRLSMQAMTEDDFVEMARTRVALPPMPWPSLRNMTEADQRSLYRYIRSLPVSGDPKPLALPPDAEPSGPWIDFSVHGLPAAATAGQ